MLRSTPITMGMQTLVHDIPQHLITLVEALRAKLRDADFLARHRVRLRILPVSAN
jgi:hypothetical protein